MNHHIALNFVSCNTAQRELVIFNIPQSMYMLPPGRSVGQFQAEVLQSLLFKLWLRLGSPGSPESCLGMQNPQAYVLHLLQQNLRCNTIK